MNVRLQVARALRESALTRKVVQTRLPRCIVGSSPVGGVGLLAPTQWLEARSEVTIAPVYTMDLKGLNVFDPSYLFSKIEQEIKPPF